MIVFRYFTREVLLSTFAISTALLFVFMSSRFVHYLGLAATGRLASDVVFSVIVYRLPTILELVLPLGLFLGILLSYGRLYVDSEMIVLSACGVSKRRLYANTMGSVLSVGIAVGALSLHLTPLGWSNFNAIWEDPSNFSGLGTIVAGRFQRAKSGNMVSYAEEVNGERSRMDNVFIATYPGNNTGDQMVVMVAESGAVLTEPKQQRRYIELRNGYRYEGNPGQLDFKITRFERYGQLIKEKKSVEVAVEVDAKTTQSLLGSDKLIDIAALQWRVSLPLMVPIIALLALALSETNHRRGRYVKLLPGIMLYLAYIVMLTAARKAIEDGRLPAALGLWVIHVAYLLLGLFLLYLSDIRRRIHASRSSHSQQVLQGSSG